MHGSPPFPPAAQPGAWGCGRQSPRDSCGRNQLGVRAGARRWGMAVGHGGGARRWGTAVGTASDGQSEGGAWRSGVGQPLALGCWAPRRGPRPLGLHVNLAVRCAPGTGGPATSGGLCVSPRLRGRHGCHGGRERDVARLKGVQLALGGGDGKDSGWLLEGDPVICVFKNTPVPAAGERLGRVGWEQRRRLERSRRELRGWTQAAARPWEWRRVHCRDERQALGTESCPGPGPSAHAQEKEDTSAGAQRT